MSPNSSMPNRQKFILPAGKNRSAKNSGACPKKTSAKNIKGPMRQF
jgi:hypothetical protein